MNFKKCIELVISIILFVGPIVPSAGFSQDAGCANSGSSYIGIGMEKMKNVENFLEKNKTNCATGKCDDYKSLPLSSNLKEETEQVLAEFEKTFGLSRDQLFQAIKENSISELLESSPENQIPSEILKNSFGEEGRPKNLVYAQKAKDDSLRKKLLQDLAGQKDQNTKSTSVSSASLKRKIEGLTPLEDDLFQSAGESKQVEATLFDLVTSRIRTIQQARLEL